MKQDNEKKREYQRNWYYQHKEERIQSHKKWLLQGNNLEKVRENARLYSEKIRLENQKLCLDCGKMHDGRRVRCSDCFKKYRQENKIPEKKFFCVCGNEIDKKGRTKLCKSCSSRARKGTYNWSDKAREKRLCEGNPFWKGNSVGYTGLHTWVKRRFPKPLFCQKCHKNEPYDLANKNNQYKRDLDDWEWLCRKCHMENDGRLNNLVKYEKKTIIQAVS